jgi:hypothetical protein
MRTALDGISGVIESGGELLEIGELANQIATIADSDVKVARSQPDQSVQSSYASDDLSWRAACDRLHFQPLSLTEQISKMLCALPKAMSEAENVQ